MQQRPPRPTGVTIIAVLAILIGILLLLGGVVLIGFSALFASSGSGVFGSFVGAILSVVGIVLAIFGLLWLLVGWGFLGGKGWAWILGMIFSILSIIGAVFSMASGFYSAVATLLIWLIMLYYLTRPRVKAFFGKGPPMGPPAGGPMMGTGAMTSIGYGTTTTMIRCSNCGTSVPQGTVRCPSCGASL